MGRLTKKIPIPASINEIARTGVIGSSNNTQPKNTPKIGDSRLKDAIFDIG